MGGLASRSLPRTSTRRPRPLPARPTQLRIPRHLWDDLREAVGRAVVGSEAPLRLIVIALLAGGHVLIEDVPGTGKTLLARAVARSLGLETNRVQGTPDLLPADVTGSSLYEGGTLRFAPGPVFTNILLVDEINRATPRTQSAMLEAMQERQVTVEGTTRPLPDPFIVLATQNSVEFEGTFALPQAQLDRFLVRAAIGYPDGDRRTHDRPPIPGAAEPLDAIEPVLDAARLVAHARRRPPDPRRRRGRGVPRRRRPRHADATRTSSSARARARRSRCTGPRRRRRSSTDRAFVLPDDVKAVAGPGPRPPADRRLRPRPPRRVTRGRSWPRSSRPCRCPTGRRSAGGS